MTTALLHLPSDKEVSHDLDILINIEWEQLAMLCGPGRIREEVIRSERKECFGTWNRHGRNLSSTPALRLRMQVVWTQRLRVIPTTPLSRLTMSYEKVLPLGQPSPREKIRGVFISSRTLTPRIEMLLTVDIMSEMIEYLRVRQLCGE